MDLENKSIEELEAIYQEASRNESKSKFGLWKDDKIISLSDLSKEELIAKVEELGEALKFEYDKEYQRELKREAKLKEIEELEKKLKQPNAETLQSFEDAKNGVGLTKHKDIKDFWKDISR